MSEHDGKAEAEAAKDGAEPSAGTPDKEPVRRSNTCLHLPPSAHGADRRQNKLSNTDALSQDTFEDTVETASVRSLTKRTVSLAKPPQDKADAEAELEVQALKATNPELKGEDYDRGKEKQEKLTLANRFSQISTVSLDNVNINDESVVQPKGPRPFPHTQNLYHSNIVYNLQKGRVQSTRSRKHCR